MSASGEFKICPFCKEKIRAEAVKCRYCGEWFEHSPRSDDSSHPDVESSSPSDSKPTSGHCNNPEPASESSESSGPNVGKETEAIGALKGWFRQHEHSLSRPSTSATVGSEPVMAKVRKLSFFAHRRTSWSVGLLLVAAAIMFFMAKDADFTSPLFVHRFTTMILRIVFCSAVLGWVVWSSNSKEKGLGLLTFSLVCVVVTIAYAYYFFRGVQEAKQRQNESKEQIAASLHNLVLQATNKGSIKFDSTGVEVFDEAFRPFIDLLNDTRGLVEKADDELADLKMSAPFSLSVLTNKSSIQSEVSKRELSQAISKKYQQNVPLVFESARQKVGSLTLSEDLRKGLLLGLDSSGYEKALMEMFDLQGRQERAEFDFLQFMFSGFDGYHISGGKIRFSLPSQSEEYERLSSEVETTAKDFTAYKQRRTELMDAAKAKLTEGLERYREGLKAGQIQR